jgi:carboxynorspermidine decarboxylase
MAVDFSKIPSPCFVTDESLLRKNLEIISSIRDQAGIDVLLALKGFAMWSVFPVINEYGFNCAAASSFNEAKLAFEEIGLPAFTYCPAYSNKEFEKISKISSHITFNSVSQFEKFYPEIKKLHNHISFGLRVNPEFSEVKTSLYNPCSTGSRLGITASQIGNSLPEEIEGLHFHTLCESTSFDLEKTLKAFENKFGHLLSQVRWVNMGGGHLITHKDYNRNHLVELLQNFKNRYPHLKVIIEPGAAFAWETGYLVSTVLDIVENSGIKTAILDISFTAHMPDCLEMPYKPMVLGASDETEGKPTYRLGGNSCLSGDFMGNWSFDQELKVGEKIVFNDMIHYTMVKTTTFNGIQHPSIGIWNDKAGLKIVKEFSYEDYKNRLS